MATSNKHKNTALLNQIGAMKSKHPQFKYTQHGSSLVFTGDLFIKPELPIYNVSIEYNGDSQPKVKINSPALVEHPPHVYSDKSICLYHPNNFKWSATKLIAKEIVHWTIAWIYFYEYWLQTGKWIGPEAAHNSPKHE